LSEAKNVVRAGFGNCRAIAHVKQKFFASFFKKEALAFYSLLKIIPQRSNDYSTRGALNPLPTCPRACIS